MPLLKTWPRLTQAAGSVSAGLIWSYRLFRQSLRGFGVDWSLCSFSSNSMLVPCFNP
ncbi:hypothetical protein GFS31_43940 (plasmid) [Leptolyngbya sp. BL0902]|nr:hypothetical protein GFS31_43940 [Leptolyngbya sp. BL0902]